MTNFIYLKVGAAEAGSVFGGRCFGLAKSREGIFEAISEEVLSMVEGSTDPTSSQFPAKLAGNPRHQASWQ
jgi:hypothetical protein